VCLVLSDQNELQSGSYIDLRKYPEDSRRTDITARTLCNRPNSSQIRGQLLVTYKSHFICFDYVTTSCDRQCKAFESFLKLYYPFKSFIEFKAENLRHWNKNGIQELVSKEIVRTALTVHSSSLHYTLTTTRKTDGVPSLSSCGTNHSKPSYW